MNKTEQYFYERRRKKKKVNAQKRTSCSQATMNSSITNIIQAIRSLLLVSMLFAIELVRKIGILNYYVMYYQRL
jgi:hypothetical protein